MKRYRLDEWTRGSFLMVVCLLACVPVPKSRGEFIAAVARGEGPTKHEVFEADAALDSVEALLARRLNECLAKTVRRSAMLGGQMHVSSSTYLPELERVDESHIEVTLRVQNRPKGTGEPKTGLYALAANLEATETGTTKVNLYAPTRFFDHIAAAVRAWSAGQDVSCPDLE